MAKPVQLFVTCLVDSVFPRIGEATVAVLRAAGFEPRVPMDQTCCGQPLYNNGLFAEAAAVARTNVAALAGDEPIVVPSGSCAWTMAKAWPELVPEDGARRVASRVVELTRLLAGAELPSMALPAPATIAWQPSCRLLRGLGVDAEPRALLGKLGGATMVDPERSSECCGFGGTFAVRFPALSTAMANDRLDAAKATGASTLVTAEPGCRMQLECASAKRGDGMRVCHVSELLAEGLPKR